MSETLPGVQTDHVPAASLDVRGVTFNLSHLLPVVDPDQPVLAANKVNMHCQLEALGLIGIEPYERGQAEDRPRGIYLGVDFGPNEFHDVVNALEGQLPQYFGEDDTELVSPMACRRYIREAMTSLGYDTGLSRPNSL